MYVPIIIFHLFKKFIVALDLSIDFNFDPIKFNLKYNCIYRYVFPINNNNNLFDQHYFKILKVRNLYIFLQQCILKYYFLLNCFYEYLLLLNLGIMFKNYFNFNHYYFNEIFLNFNHFNHYYFNDFFLNFNHHHFN